MRRKKIKKLCATVSPFTSNGTATDPSSHRLKSKCAQKLQCCNFSCGIVENKSHLVVTLIFWEPLTEGMTRHESYHFLSIYSFCQDVKSRLQVALQFVILSRESS